MLNFANQNENPNRITEVMENIVFDPKSKQELELLNVLGKMMGIKYSIALWTAKQKEKKKKLKKEPAFVPGNPKKAKESIKQVFGMWADRKDIEDVNEWRRKLWERES